MTHVEAAAHDAADETRELLRERDRLRAQVAALEQLLEVHEATSLEQADRLDRALAAAKAERQRLYEVFMQAPVAIAVLEGPDHVFTVVNPRYSELVGDRPVKGLPVREALPEVVEQGFVTLLDRVYQTGETYSASETPVLLERKGRPEQVYVDIEYQAMRDLDGRPFGILVLAVDMTVQVQARRVIEQRATELARLTSELERSNRELDQFAYVASHDLKAPLRGIANLTQWIEEDLGDRVTGESKEHMRLLKGRTHRMEALIDGILAYSRAGRVREPVEPVDVAALLAETIELVSPPAAATIVVASGMPVLETERVPLQQVFINLLGNALKYGQRPDLHVTIEAAPAETGCVRFSVSDNGPGIAPQYHERIWQIFQTLAARDKVEGTGIGLSVVRKLVESRGGRAWLDSEPGRGTTFHFTWPTIPRTAS